MKELIEEAREKILAAMLQARRTCVLWSGGKDSTVVLHLARSITPDIECVFWTLPWQRGTKLAFAQRVAREWGLTVHDSPPASAALCKGNGRIDVMETYTLKGAGQTLTVARGTEPLMPGEPFVCGVDWLERPKAATAFPWDLALHGHKSSDMDPLSGPVPLAADFMHYPEGTDVLFPLRGWTDEDVMQYTAEHRLPVDTSRYEPNGQPLPDKRANSDYYHACFACCEGAEFVPCPKRGGQVINSLAPIIPWVSPAMPYCNLRTNR